MKTCHTTTYRCCANRSLFGGTAHHGRPSQRDGDFFTNANPQAPTTRNGLSWNFSTTAIQLRSAKWTFTSRKLRETCYYNRLWRLDKLNTDYKLQARRAVSQRRTPLTHPNHGPSPTSGHANIWESVTDNDNWRPLVQDPSPAPLSRSSDIHRCLPNSSWTR